MRIRGTVWGSLVAVSLPECGQPAAPTTDSPAHPVGGRVMVDGKPAAGVEVHLYPLNRYREAGVARPRGTTDRDGGFRLVTGEGKEGAPSGQYHVTLVWPAGGGGADRFGGAYAEPDGSGLTALIDDGTAELPTFNVSAGRRGRR
jgi:hypothetical protein